MPRPRRLPKFAALSLVTLATIAGILAIGSSCAEHDCAPNCGDCLDCEQLAHLSRPEAPLPTEAKPRGAPVCEPKPTARPPRAVEHVPLARA